MAISIWARAITGRAREVPIPISSTPTHSTSASYQHTQQVDVLVDGIAGNGREAKLLHEFPCSPSVSLLSPFPTSPMAIYIRRRSTTSAFLAPSFKAFSRIASKSSINQNYQNNRVPAHSSSSRSLRLPSWPTSAAMFMLANVPDSP